MLDVELVLDDLDAPPLGKLLQDLSAARLHYLRCLVSLPELAGGVPAYVHLAQRNRLGRDLTRRHQFPDPFAGGDLENLGQVAGRWDERGMDHLASRAVAAVPCWYQSLAVATASYRNFGGAATVPFPFTR